MDSGSWRQPWPDLGNCAIKLFILLTNSRRKYIMDHLNVIPPWSQHMPSWWATWSVQATPWPRIYVVVTILPNQRWERDIKNVKNIPNLVQNSNQSIITSHLLKYFHSQILIKPHLLLLQKLWSNRQLTVSLSHDGMLWSRSWMTVTGPRSYQEKYAEEETQRTVGR